ncbi:hypothetical protein HDU82_004016 [Entophlyctis luteolus]|nr:hypothetical protein HDU82_004016 [Entophlyctis luteolus]
MYLVHIIRILGGVTSGSVDVACVGIITQFLVCVCSAVAASNQQCSNEFKDLNYGVACILNLLLEMKANDKCASKQAFFATLQPQNLVANNSSSLVQELSNMSAAHVQFSIMMIASSSLTAGRLSPKFSPSDFFHAYFSLISSITPDSFLIPVGSDGESKITLYNYMVASLIAFFQQSIEYEEQFLQFEQALFSVFLEYPEPPHFPDPMTIFLEVIAATVISELVFLVLRELLNAQAKSNPLEWVEKLGPGFEGAERWIWCGSSAIDVYVQSAIKLWDEFLQLLDQDEQSNDQQLMYLQSFEFSVRLLNRSVQFLGSENCDGACEAVICLLCGMKDFFEIFRGRAEEADCTSVILEYADMYDLVESLFGTKICGQAFMSSSVTSPKAAAVAAAAAPKLLSAASKEAITVEQLLALSGVPSDRTYLLESDVGITAFLNPLQKAKQLSAIIKHRYTDFLVNEVDLNGKVLHLEPSAISSVSAKQEAAAAAKAFDVSKIDPAVFEEMRDFFDEADADRCVQEIKTLLDRNNRREFTATENVESARKRQKTDQDEGEKTSSKSDEVLEDETLAKDAAPAGADSVVQKNSRKSSKPEKPKVPEILTKSIPDKGDRVAVYDFFKLHFPEVLATDSRGDQKIVIRTFTNRDRQRSLPRPDFRPSGPGEHLSFVLYKENKDTMECLNHIARVTKTPTASYSFAGTKDKRAVTVQRCSGHRIFQSKLEGINFGTGIRIGNFKYVKDRVNLGDLLGNFFAITLRDVSFIGGCDGSPDDIPDILEASLKSLQTNGFINYYGMQRFGTRSISTHQVGLAMLTGSWKTAVDLIMMPKGDERPDCIEARKVWMETRDYEKCRDLFPKYCMAERAILNSMSKNRSPSKCFEALCTIPRNLRLMYVHAVQSFVWNHAASERIRMYGNKIVKGDLVMKANPLSGGSKSAASDLPDDDSEIADITAVAEHRQGRLMDVELVESDEAAATKSIEDLVLPLPGHSIKYPTNEIGDFYKLFMAKYMLDPHDMKRKYRETSLAGDYRRVIIKPKDVTWEILHYDNPHYPLSRTDVDIINGVPEPVSIPDGKKIGVVVRFVLETSSYATMALREILRSDTGSGFQSNMSRSADAEKKGVDSETVAVDE